MYYSFLSLKYDQSIIVKTFFSKRTVVNIVGEKIVLFYSKIIINFKGTNLFGKKLVCIARNHFFFLS